MTTQQPVWIVAANLGDASPLEHGGAFVLIDATGVYEAELWRYEPDGREMVRFSLDRCHRTATGEIMGGYAVGDNVYHPQSVAWFGSSEDLESVVSYADHKKLVIHLCGHNVIDRAGAYLDLCGYWGSANFDGYPDHLTAAQAKKLIGRLQRCLVSKRPFNPSIA